MTGNLEAMNQIGILYENGLGVAQDYAEARQWYAEGCYSRPHRCRVQSRLIVSGITSAGNALTGRGKNRLVYLDAFDCHPRSKLSRQIPLALVPARPEGRLS